MNKYNEDIQKEQTPKLWVMIHSPLNIIRNYYANIISLKIVNIIIFSTISVLVSIHDELNIIIVIFLIKPSVTLAQVTQFTINRWHKTLIQVKIKFLFCYLWHFELKLQQFLISIKNELIFAWVGNSYPLSPECHSYFRHRGICFDN